MMDELVKLVSQKTGISQDQAKVAVELVVKFIKEKLPSPLAAQIDGLLSGSGNPSDLLKNVGGLFGQK
jgi:nucleoid DNA-binding protein